MATIGNSKGFARQFVDLTNPDNQVEREVLPRLWAPVLEAIGPDMLRLRGVQQVDGRAYLQVWLCRLAKASD